MKNTKRSNKRSSKSKRHDSNPDPRGDVPKGAKHTHSTVSVAIPRITSQYTTRQLNEPSIVVASAVGNVNPTYNFQLGFLDNLSPFVALFDQYRIDAIRFTIVPQNNAIGLVTNSTTTLEPLYCVIDYDDSNALTSVAQCREYDNCVILYPAESAQRTFQPRMALAAYSGGFSSYANVAPTWVDVASASVQHYGVKLFVPQATAAQTLLQSWNVEIEYFISFRSIR
jgi:hypothetical protein